jgi:hypothetical protein
MNTIATLYQLQQHLGLEAGDDDDRLLIALQSATAQIERLSGRRFYPRVATIDHTVDPRNPTQLLLDDDLLALDSVTGNDGNDYATDDLLLIPGGEQPASVIQLIASNSFTWADTPVQAISLSGTWGWHDHWPAAWRDSGDVVKDAALGASDTTITVGDAEGSDGEGASPRFQVGQLLKIEDEYLYITTITVNAGSDDTLTVLRGVNGTTAVAHAQDSMIYSYQPAADVTLLCLRWAGWLYRETDGRIPDQVPAALLDTLAPLRRVRVGG